MSKKRLSTYDEFWVFYVGEHRSRINRNLHFLGTSMGLLLCIFAVFKLEPRVFIFAPFVGYGFAWAGHFFFEKNRPATFQYPIWSLRGDFQMFRLMCLGRMDAEISRYFPL